MTIIKVENLGKRYLIGHDKKADGAFRYNSIRDSIYHSMRGVYQKIRHPLSPNKENITLEEFWALQDINFEINQGDKVGIIGPNGAGKTTLLKLLSRITHPTTGSIKIKGRIASLLEVGTGFHQELSGRENIYLNGAILGMRRLEIRKNFDEIVAFAEVEKFLDTPVKRYSSGMYVRLAFAVAAHLEPEILIVDEVLAVGDAAFQKKSLGKMEDVSKEGRTVIFVSHNMLAMSKLCDNAILLNKGRIQKQDCVNLVIDEYFSKLYKTIESENFTIDNFRREPDEQKEIKFVDIKINNVPHASIDIGNDINVHFKIYSLINLQQINITIQILNNIGEVVTTILSMDNENNFNICKGNNSIQCNIEQPGLYLMPGKYYITAGINKFVGSKASDVIVNYPAFEISNSGTNSLSIRHDRPGVFYHKKINWNKSD